MTAQIQSGIKDLGRLMALYLEGYELDVSGVDRYSGVSLKARCSSCGALGLSRELDAMAPAAIAEVPVMPIFVCMKCGHRHYSLTDEHLKYMIATNKRMFEAEELKSLDERPEETINVIREYIIRIFASKKISRAIIE